MPTVYYCRDWLAGNKSIIQGKITGNQRIEAFWSKLRRGGGGWWVNYFKDLRDSGTLGDYGPRHGECLKLCFTTGTLFSCKIVEFKTHPNQTGAHAYLPGCLLQSVPGVKWPRLGSEFTSTATDSNNQNQREHRRESWRLQVENYFSHTDTSICRSSRATTLLWFDNNAGRCVNLAAVVVARRCNSHKRVRDYACVDSQSSRLSLDQLVRSLKRDKSVSQTYTRMIWNTQALVNKTEYCYLHLHRWRGASFCACDPTGR